MTKQMKAAMAAMLMVGTIAAYPQAPLSTTTKTEKVAPGETKTTVITKEQGATGSTSGSKLRRKRSRKPVGKKTTAKKAPAESATVRQIRELQATQLTQQAQIDALTQANAAKDAALAQANAAAQTAETQAQAATAATQTVSSSVQANTDAVQALKSNVTDLQTANTGLATTISQNKQELTEKIESPMTVHYKGLNITPVGFLAFEGVFRQRALNSDIVTPFNLTPYMGSNDSRLSELNFSARQTRLGALVEGKAASYKLTGFVETDFLSAGVTSNNNESNSYTLRIRTAWGKAETNGGFSVTGGQTWSLATQNSKSTDVRTEVIPMTIDPQYVVGYSWERQPGIRLQQKIGHPLFGAGVTVAVSAEQAQTQLASSSPNIPNNFIFGGAGQAAGTYNAFNGTYANNVAPDLLAKIAFDASKYAHFEVGGVGRFFRDEYYPLILNGTTGVTTSLSPNLQKNTKFGGGVFANFRVSAYKFLDFGAQAMAGDGTARYGSAQLGDVTVHPDGTLEPIRNYHGLISLEAHPTPRLDIVGYAGGEYNQRTVYTNFTGALEGYGPRTLLDTQCNVIVPPAAGTAGTGTTAAPGTTGTCQSPTRAIEEGVIGFIFRAVNSPKYGRLQYEGTYSYLTKTSWTGITAGTAAAPTAFGSAKATNNMAHISMRYYLP